MYAFYAYILCSMLMSRPYIDIDSVVPYRASEINYIFSIYFSVPGHSSNAHRNMPTYHYKYYFSFMS